MLNLLDLTLDTPAQNLALDEALLDVADRNPNAETLRFWESKKYFVVLGYSNHFDRESFYSKAVADDVAVLRRASGGGAVLQGPGCLNYSLILRISQYPELRNIHDTNCFIMKKIQNMFLQIDPDIEFKGLTDLSRHDLKFSGNAQRRKREAVLFHGTFLYKFKISQIEKYLKPPSSEPDYRDNRSHKKFLTNISINPHWIKKSFAKDWEATNVTHDYPKEIVEQLVQTRYSQDAWNKKY